MNKFAYNSFINWHHLRWQTSALILLLTAVSVLEVEFHKDVSELLPETRALASTFNTRDSGLSGLWQLTGKAGLSADTWQLPYRKLSEKAGMLVMVAPTELPADYECKQILNWVAEGNDLVYFDDFTFKFTHRLLQILDIDARTQGRVIDLPIAPTASKPEFAHVKSLTVSSDTRLTEKKKLIPIVADKTGVILGVLDYGAGHILIGSVPDFAANRRFAERSNWPNFQFLINWFRKAHGQILFDERCHGFFHGVNVFAFLFAGPFAFFFFQLCLIALVAVCSSLTRFGPTRELEGDRRPSVWAFIEAQASLLLRAKSNNLVFSIIRQELAAKLKRLTTASDNDSDETIATKLPATVDRDELLFLLRYPADIDSIKQMDDRELLKLVLRLDKITNTLRNYHDKVNLAQDKQEHAPGKV